MTDLVGFLLARIAEDEALAREAALVTGWRGFGDERVGSGSRWTTSYHKVRRKRSEDDEEPLNTRDIAECAPLHGISVAEHMARHDPARALAECEAKRRIIDQFSGVGWDGYTIRDVVLGLLALPYADHEDYRQAFRP